MERLPRRLLRSWRLIFTRPPAESRDERPEEPLDKEERPLDAEPSPEVSDVGSKLDVPEEDPRPERIDVTSPVEPDDDPRLGRLVETEPRPLKEPVPGPRELKEPREPGELEPELSEPRGLVLDPSEESEPRS